MLRRDVDYIVRDRRIQIVDEFTGRVVTDRHWPDGLQAALEAKEGLEPRPDGRILGSMTLQRSCAATAVSRHDWHGPRRAPSFTRSMVLRFLVVPTHRPMIIAVDRPDIVFTDREAKATAVVAEIRRAHELGPSCWGP